MSRHIIQGAATRRQCDRVETVRPDTSSKELPPGGRGGTRNEESRPLPAPKGGSKVGIQREGPSQCDLTSEWTLKKSGPEAGLGQTSGAGHARCSHPGKEVSEV